MKIIGTCLINILRSHKKISKGQLNTYEKLFNKIFTKIYQFSFIDNKKRQASPEQLNLMIEENPIEESKNQYFNDSYEHERNFSIPPQK